MDYSVIHSTNILVPGTVLGVLRQAEQLIFVSIVSSD